MAWSDVKEYASSAEHKALMRRNKKWFVYCMACLLFERHTKEYNFLIIVINRYENALLCEGHPKYWLILFYSKRKNKVNVFQCLLKKTFCSSHFILSNLWTVAGYDKKGFMDDSWWNSAKIWQNKGRLWKTFSLHCHSLHLLSKR